MKKSTSKKLRIKSMKVYNRLIAAVLGITGLFIALQTDSAYISIFRNGFDTNEAIDSDPLVKLIVTTLLGFVLLVSSATYLLNSTTARGWYLKNLGHKINIMRWLDYSVASVVLTLLVAILAGFNDLVSLVLIAFLALLPNFYGLVMEKVNTKKKNVNWAPYALSLALHFILIALLFFGSQNIRTPSVIIERGELNILFASLFATSLAYSLAMFAHYKKLSIWKDYINTEQTFMLIDLLSKTLICGLIYYFVR